METKNEIRKVMKAKRREVDGKERETAALALLDRLVETKDYQDAKSVYAFVSYNDEIDTFPIMRRVLEDKKRLFAPKIEAGVMSFYEIMNIDRDLSEGAFGILEPNTGAMDISHNGLMLMPGLAFDKEHNRVGYGKGFYDKYLSWPNSHIKIAIGYDFQVIDDVIPTREDDIKADYIITDKGVY